MFRQVCPVLPYRACPGGLTIPDADIIRRRSSFWTVLVIICFWHSISYTMQVYVVYCGLMIACGPESSWSLSNLNITGMIIVTWNTTRSTYDDDTSRSSLTVTYFLLKVRTASGTADGMHWHRDSGIIDGSEPIQNDQAYRDFFSDILKKKYSLSSVKNCNWKL